MSVCGLSEVILIGLRHALDCLLELSKCSSHIFAKLQEFVPCCRKLNRCNGCFGCFLPSIGLLDGKALNFRELFEIDMHAYIDIKRFYGTLC